jgi:hypothetical protein
MQVPPQNAITILPMFLAGRFCNKNEADAFAGFVGVMMGLGYGKSECSGVRLRE